MLTRSHRLALSVCACAVAASAGRAQTGLSFNGSSDQVAFGNAAATPDLGLGQFTIEFWFQRTGTGTTASTGTGGFTGLPIVTKGRGEAEASNVDMNYFTGIRTSDNVLAADFEEGAGQPSPGLNHPVFGATPIANNTWYHAAFTYDGSDWTIYLNGAIDGSDSPGVAPRSDSIQHFGVGTAFNSSGSAQGRFQGVVDEVRVWDHALTQGEIISRINDEIASTNGLVGRWGFNEGSGPTAFDSSVSGYDGTITGAAFVTGAPFDINLSPNPPTLVSPADHAQGVSLNPTLEVTVSDPEADTLDVVFYGRQVGGAPTEDFSIVAMPDTQFYACGSACPSQGGDPATFSAQTQWILDNLDALNIEFVTQLGDCVQNGDNGGNPVEWEVASNAFGIIEDPVTTLLADGIPFGVAVGNHDQSPTGNADGTTNYYNQYFGESHFTGRGYYGGHYGANNDNHYELFSAGGIDFIIIHLEYDTSPDAAVLDWADDLLQTYSQRKAILVSHYFLDGNGAFGTQGQATYDALKANPNLFLMLCGHVHEEARRSDTFAGNEVHTLLSDYQDRTNGGDGWLRILHFNVADNTIDVETYSPTLDQYEQDASSEFTLTYAGGGFVGGFSEIGSATGVASGANASVVWSSVARSLPSGETFEWYAEVSDGSTTTTGPVWTFTTACGIDADCDDGNACTDDVCSTGVCENTFNTDPCDDGDLCTESDACSAGACAGTPVVCGGGEVCDENTGICAAPVSVSFQQGVSGYTGTVDTYLDDGNPDTDNGASTNLVVDVNVERHILLRFDDIFGNAAGQVPPDATILSADLTIQVTNESVGVGASLHRMVQTWNDSDTWNTWGSGIQADGIEALATADTSGDSGTGPYTLDVTTSVAAWNANPTTNHGWAWLPPVADNSWQFNSSEAASNQPLLEITYLPKTCASAVDCDDDNPCTDDVCSSNVCSNSNNTDACDDNDGCTLSDVCSAGACAGTPVVCTGGEVCDPSLSACVTPIATSFQQGVSGYGSTLDTYLDNGNPDTDNGASTTLVVDVNVERHILLRFDDIFGAAAGQIPPGATIFSADLTVQITNESVGVGASLHRMAQTWDDSDTWNIWGSGIQADDIEALVAADASGDSDVGPYTLDVTTSLSAWSANPAVNFGWAWLPPVADNSWQFDSSEAATPANRPLLEVVYLPLPCTTELDCDDSNLCTDDACGTNGVCTNDAIPGCCVDDAECDDNNPCTTDACTANECVNDPIPNCCSTSADCDDASDCTIDECLPGNVAALAFDGSSDQVSMGAAPGLNAAEFTLECWFRKTGAGDSVSTGGGGLTGGDVAVPLVTKGRGEADGDNRDMNYFLGLHAANSTIVADFEEHTSGGSPGLNHPVIADTAITDSDWHHAAVTYDGSCWQVYLDGVDDNAAANCPAQPPNFVSIQHFAIGTALTSTASADGRWQGEIDEVRVWDHARSAADIADGMDRQIISSNGLLGRWGLNEGSGAAASDSTTYGNHGLIDGATWVSNGLPDFGLGACAHADIPECCESGSDCDDLDACTLDDCGSNAVSALAFDGANDSVHMGAAPLLGAAQFTVECWFNRTGTGVTGYTGSGGINALPLITKGRAQADGDNRDMNYFLGIEGTSGALAFDFEDTASGLNHPLVAATTIPNDEWHHAAVTYDGAVSRLYLDGQPDGTDSPGATPRFDSVQHFGLGTAFNDSGSPDGAFAGLIDEVRVWDHARTEAEIQSTLYVEISAAPGLLGRWGLNETAGAVAIDTAGNGNDGSISGASYDTNGVELIGFAACSNTPIAGCCDDVGDCDDDDLCTIDACSNAVCEYTVVDCSFLDDDCNVGVCASSTGLCAAQPANEAGACDDLDDCTVADVCSSGVCAGFFADCDTDGVCDADDNCPTVSNSGQENVDFDAYGDACDGLFDFDHDGDVDLYDHAVFADCIAGPDVFAAPITCPAGGFADADADGDGDVDLADFAALLVEFSGTFASPCEY